MGSELCEQSYSPERQKVNPCRASAGSPRYDNEMESYPKGKEPEALRTSTSSTNHKSSILFLFSRDERFFHSPVRLTTMTRTGKSFK